MNIEFSRNIIEKLIDEYDNFQNPVNNLNNEKYDIWKSNINDDNYYNPYYNPYYNNSKKIYDELYTCVSDTTVVKKPFIQDMKNDIIKFVIDDYINKVINNKFKYRIDKI